MALRLRRCRLLDVLARRAQRSQPSTNEGRWRPRHWAFGRGVPSSGGLSERLRSSHASSSFAADGGVARYASRQATTRAMRSGHANGMPAMCTRHVVARLHRPEPSRADPVCSTPVALCFSNQTQTPNPLAAAGHSAIHRDQALIVATFCAYPYESFVKYIFIAARARGPGRTRWTRHITPSPE